MRGRGGASELRSGECHRAGGPRWASRDARGAENDAQNPASGSSLPRGRRSSVPRSRGAGNRAAAHNAPAAARWFRPGRSTPGGRGVKHGALSAPPCWFRSGRSTAGRWGDGKRGF